jgi:homoserine dehydrogenase
MRIALVGCGTVGTGVAKVLLMHPQRLTQRCGQVLELAKIVVKHADKPRPNIPLQLLTTHLSEVLADVTLDIVVELIGGTTAARDVVLQSLMAGKHVVTANKALLAEHGIELFECARKHNRVIAFEASVAGGIPIIGAIAQGLTANQITAIQGILNGTSNFILTQMDEKGMPYAEALAEAQRLGYAEADPTLDVDGSDAAAKLCVLAQLAFGLNVTVKQIERQGIAEIHAMDLKYAREFGYRVKLLAEAWLDGTTVALHVAPVLLRNTDMLAQVRGARNAVQVTGDVVGETLFQGAGAGELPTASAVIADLVDIASGRAMTTFQACQLWQPAGKGFQLRSSAGVRSRFYLRVLVEDTPGTLADVARSLAEEGISISSVIQHEAVEDHPGVVVPLVILTHTALTGKFLQALKRINNLPGIASPGAYYSMDD